MPTQTGPYAHPADHWGKEKKNGGQPPIPSGNLQENAIIFRRPHPRLTSKPRPAEACQGRNSSDRGGLLAASMVTGYNFTCATSDASALCAASSDAAVSPKPAATLRFASLFLEAVSFSWFSAGPPMLNSTW